MGHPPAAAAATADATGNIGGKTLREHNIFKLGQQRSGCAYTQASNVRKYSKYFN